jgi:D-aminopeptidase
VLTIAGAPVGKELGRYEYQPEAPRLRAAGKGQHVPVEQDGGSCMIVVATDAPIDARDLKRLAARAIFGLARTGSSFSNGSGDYAIAFTTSTELRSRPGGTQPPPRRILPTDAVSPLFQAALEATEEAVYNALLRATTTTGSGRTLEAIPIDSVREILKRHNLERQPARPAAAAQLDIPIRIRLIPRFGHQSHQRGISHAPVTGSIAAGGASTDLRLASP